MHEFLTGMVSDDAASVVRGRVTRRGDVVMLERWSTGVDGGPRQTLYEFDLAQGCNLIHYVRRAPERGYLDEERYSYDSINGVFVPRKVTLHNEQREHAGGQYVRDWTVEFTENQVNEPLAPSEFTFEAMEVLPGAFVTDDRFGLRYTYGVREVEIDMPVPALPEPETHRPWLFTQRRIDAQIKALEAESLEDSLRNLAEIEMYVWPGKALDAFGLQLPLADSAGEWDVDLVMSNRRFVKVLQEISSLPQAEQAALLRQYMRTSLASYQTLLEEYVRETTEKVLAPGVVLVAGPSFRMSNNSDGSATLQGARYRLLALLLVAGNARLKEVAPAVLAIAQEARKQRLKFYDTKQFNRQAAYIMLKHASLYNRQIVGMALLATCVDPADTDGFLSGLDVEWKTKKLTYYDAAATPYDHHASTGSVPVDYSKGELLVRYLGPLGDGKFDRILERAMASQRD